MEKKLAQTTAEIKQQYPESTVETWAEDEHRIGLQPVNRIIWVEKGQQPIANVHWRFQWLWLAGFVHPSSGETYWWIVPKLNTKVFSLLLKDFAQHFQIGQKKRVILALDQASFHTSEQLEIPEGIHLMWMPPKSPELQPAERLWPLTNEAIANRTFDDLDQLERRVQLSTRKLGFQSISRKMPLFKVSQFMGLKKVAHGVTRGNYGSKMPCSTSTAKIDSRID